MSEVKQLPLPTTAPRTIAKANAAQSAEADAADAFAQHARKNNHLLSGRKCPLPPPRAVSYFKMLTHHLLHIFGRAQERAGKRVRTGDSTVGAALAMEGIEAQKPEVYTKEAEEVDSDDEDEEELMKLMTQNAMNALAKPSAQDDKFTVASPDKGKIAVGATVYALATKNGGLAKDNIASVIAAAAQGKNTFLTYLEKPADREELKGAAMITCSQVTAALLLKYKGESNGVRFIDEATAKADPQFAARLEGITVIVLRTAPKGMVIDNETHLEFLANELCASILSNLPAMTDKMVKDGYLDADKAAVYKDVKTATIKNVETVSTLGKTYTMKSTKNAIYIVAEFKDSTGKAHTLPYIGHCGAIPEELETVKIVDGEARKERLVGKGATVVTTKTEQLGLMYCAFCPHHAHAFHLAPCKKWMATVEARKKLKARIETQGEKKNTARSSKYEAAASSTTSDARF